LDLKPPPDSREVTLIVKAASTLNTIIQTFENRTTEQAEFENLLSGGDSSISRIVIIS
jgi:hypothetical protein